MDGVTRTLFSARAARAGLLLGALLLLALAPSAHAISVTGLDLSATSTQAGAHSNVRLVTNMSDGKTQGMRIDLPPGMLADVSGPTVCSTASFNANTCAASSKIGEITATIDVLDLLVGAARGSIYRMAPVNSGEVVRMGIFLRPDALLNVQADDIFLQASVTLRDASGGAADQGGLRATILNMPSSAPVVSSGFPGFLIYPTGSTVSFDIKQIDMTLYGTANGKPFMNNPGRCATQSASVALLNSAGTLVQHLLTRTGGSDVFTPTGCDSLSHAPTTAITAATPDMDKGSAMTVDVNVADPLPASGNIKALTKKAVINLPTGVEINPAGAVPLSACSSAQFNFSSNAAPTCPVSSKIGTAAITTPLLTHLGGGGTLTGDVYFGDLGASSSEILRLFVSVELAGVRVKLIGDMAIDDATGRVTATFDDIPQTPFSKFSMTFNGGDNAILRTPRSCSATAHEMASTLTAYGDGTPTVASPTSDLDITANCFTASRFGPSVSQSASTTAAGADTSWTLTMTRPQGDARFSAATVSLPTGLVGKLGSVTPCSTANANAGTCPTSSRVGVVTTKSGDSAAAQAVLNGEVFLTEAPSGAIAGLSLKVPAIVGPANLGNVIVPMKILLRSDYGLDIVADSIPQRVAGVPLLLRELELTMNQTAGNTSNPFMINGTQCTAKTVTAALTSDQSSSASPTTTYQPTGCGSVPFNPTVAVNPSASLAPAVNATPDTAGAMSIGVSMPANRSAVKDLTLNLPTGVELNPYSATSLTYCSAAQFNVSSLAPDTCATSSRLGTVSVTTPSVGTLTGYAYFGAPTAGSPILRMFVMAQSGAGADAIRLKFAGDVAIDSSTGRMTATFTDLPAIQFTQLTVSFNGGTSAPLRTPRTCSAASMTSTLTAHAGVANATPSATLTTSGCAATTFTPSLSRTLSSTTAGGGTNLSLTVTRNGSDARFTSADISLPPGLIGKLSSVTPCSTANANAGTCPASSQIGTVQTQSGDTALTSATLNGQLYLTEAPAGAIAGLSIAVPAVVGEVNLGTVIVPLKIKLRASDYGLDITADSIPQRVQGVPLLLRSIQLTIDRTAGNTATPFMLNSTNCTARTIAATFGNDASTSASTSAAYQPTSCGSLAFGPTVAVNPGANLTPAASATSDTASAMTVGVTVPGGSSAVKDLTLNLPTGVELNPYSATQLRYCSAAQFNSASVAPDTCATNTRLGTVSLVVPHIGTLTGYAYFGQPANSTQILRLFVMAQASGATDAIRIKLVGDVAVDETTGRMTATFTDLPAIQFSQMTLSFNGGSAAPLRTPRTCGTSSMNSTLTAHAGSSNATPSANLTTTSCTTTFNPSLSQTSSPTSAGQGTTFSVTMTRSQGDARFTGATVQMPAGLVGKLSSVTPCSTANANAGTCPTSSQIGVVETGSGDTASTQATLNGQIYLTDAPAGAIAGLSVKVRALVGDVDLGDVIVPMKITLRPSDYGLNIVADSIPQRVKGVPLLLRSMKLTIDRTAGNTSNPFMIHSSSCTARTIEASFDHDRSGSGSANTSYQPTNCSGLAFTPSVGLNPSTNLTPVVNASPDAPSAMTLGVTVPANHAAVKNLTLNFPQGVELNPYSATTLQYCSTGQFDAASLAPDTCPTASRLAPVTITTPSVGTLSGYAYFGSPANSSQILRLYVMAESGPGADAVRIKFTGDLDLDNNGRLTARFTDLPVVQFTQMTMKFPGGSNAPLRTPRACGTTTLTSSMVGHAGGAAKSPSTTLTVSGGNCDAARFTPTASTTVSTTTAGASTSLTTTISRTDGDARVKKVKVVMPPGLLGNLTAVPQCALATALAANCSSASEVGTVTTETGESGASIPQNGKVYLSTAPSGGVAGLVMVVNAVVGEVNLGNIVVPLTIIMRQSDGGLTIEGDVPTYVKGVPLNLRQITLQVTKPGFLLNRSVCDQTSITTELTSDLGSTKSATTPYQATACSSLSFTPTLDVSTATPAADSATAMSLAVNVPASGQAQVKDVTVKLPEGIEINPGAGDGLAGCSVGQFAPDTSRPDGCPAAAKIGTATVNSPLVGTLTGSVYFGDPAPGKLMRMFVVAEAGAGDTVRIKLVGDVDVDPTTGRITTTFSNLPQTPFTKFQLDLQGGKRAVLTTPRQCGTFRADSSLVPYGGLSGVAPSANIAVSDGCGDPFRPAIDLARSTNRAGSDTALTTTISRQDGDARLSRISVKLPDGLLGRLGAVPQCDLGAARTGDCPAASRVGSATTVSGSGDSTISLPGDVFLTQGWDGAVAGLAVVVQAKAGPIDLGRAVVMMKINVRENASGITIESEAIPTRLQGVPLTLKSIGLKIDRDGFMFNATSCGTAGASAAFTSDVGSTAEGASSLTTTDCGAVPFSPSMNVELPGGLKKDAKPGVVAKLAVPSGHANVRKVTLTLPPGIGADISALQNTCPRETYDAGGCPAKSVVGSATATSPAISGALTGPVTLIKKQGSALPDLGVRLRGLVNVDLVGSVSLGAGNRLITTFDGIPDVPLSSFELGLNGGAKGALVVSGDACSSPEITAALTAHTGASKTTKSKPAKTGCGAAAKTKDVPPSATVRIAYVKSGKPILKVTAKRGSAALKTVAVTLPKGLGVDRRVAGRKTKLQALNPKGRKLKLTPKAVAWKARSFTLKLPKTGARSATMSLRRGALRSTKKLQKAKQFTIRVKLTPVSGKARTQQIKVRIGSTKR